MTLPASQINAAYDAPYVTIQVQDALSWENPVGDWGFGCSAIGFSARLTGPNGSFATAVKAGCKFVLSTGGSVATMGESNSLDASTTVSAAAVTVASTSCDNGQYGSPNSGGVTSFSRTSTHSACAHAGYLSLRATIATQTANAIATNALLRPI